VAAIAGALLSSIAVPRAPQAVAEWAGEPEELVAEAT
jgi:hypothetical protein